MEPNLQHGIVPTTGYEPKHNAPEPPPGLGPDALLDWYLAHHAAKAPAPVTPVYGGVPALQQPLMQLPPAPQFATMPTPQQAPTPPYAIAPGGPPYLQPQGLFPGISSTAPMPHPIPLHSALPWPHAQPMPPPAHTMMPAGDMVQYMMSGMAKGMSTAPSMLNPMQAPKQSAPPPVTQDATPAYLTPQEEQPPLSA